MDQKIENLLNISLQSTKEEREKSLDLDTGYLPDEDIWEIIVKYNGNPDFLAEKYPGTKIDKLLGEFAIIFTRQEYVNDIARENVIDYVEKPKSLYFNLEYSKVASCILSDYGRNEILGGRDVIVAIIDSDIDILNGEFQKPDGTTRILNIWNQENGQQYNQEEINDAIKNNQSIAYGAGMHGTNVALIACGNNGVAYEADIIGVKLAVSRTNSFPRTTEVMRAFDYVIRRAMEHGKPVAINLSLGNNYGSHDGTSILENYINTVSNIWKSVICIGVGNEAVRGIHTSGVVSEEEDTIVQLTIGDFETSINIQIWKEYADEFEVELINPSGNVIGPISERGTIERFRTGNTEVMAFYGEPGPYSKVQEIYFELLPADTYIDGGLWRIRLIPRRIANGRFDMWLPSSVVLNDNTRFVNNSEELTMTIPALAQRAISVGAYNPRNDVYSDFSGRGYMSGKRINKPDIVAPGYDIVLEAGTINERSVTGTSFATPFVTGAAACVMQWGVVEGNDLFLYGEKVKAYLMRGARQLPGFYETPNTLTGWGALCLADSIPK